MRLVTDQKRVKRNITVGKYAFTAGMALLVGALVINFLALNRPDDPQMVIYAFAAFLIGFTLTNVGTYFNNRWGRRPDKGLAEALRGLDDRYTLYNYRFGASHVLAGPNGLHVLIPKYQFGLIQYANGKWTHPGRPRGLFFGMASRDPLGNPGAEAAAELNQLTTFLQKRVPELKVAPQALIVFLNPRAEVSAKESPIPALHVKQLKDYLRRLPKGAALPAQTQAEMEAKLGLAATKVTG
jgi:hypothetical protein